MYSVEVYLMGHLPDARGMGLVKDILDLGITTVSGARVVDIYWLEGEELKSEEVEVVACSLLADPVTQEYRWYVAGGRPKERKAAHTVEVAYNPGVTDPTEDSIMKAIRDLGVTGVRRVRTAKKYLLEGRLSGGQLDTIAAKLLVNPIIQHVVKEEPAGFPTAPLYTFALKMIDIRGMSARDRRKVQNEYGFNDDEFGAILAHYQKLERNPTDVELETLAQTWSEHCVHKTFKGKIRFGNTVIDNLLKSTVIKATNELNKPWCLSVFEDNAGVIDFNGRYAVCFKVETHNHPSAVEPYGGAATGIGGVIRDPLGTGLGAKPIANTDVFCFAPPDFPHEKLPRGVLHPRRIFKGVRAGVADYGNRMGIPTLNGAVLFDERYLANPLVFCGTVGVMPRELARPARHKPGDLIVLGGGRTGRDGIRGVTFASVELTGESAAVSTSSVQIGNAIVEKKLVDVLLPARDRRLYRRITDCGGGGLSSAIGEMGAETGARVYLEKVPLKYAGLTYTEIWVSESQERMLLAVPPEKVEELLKLFASEDVEATVIGEFTDDHRLQLLYQGHLVCDMEMGFLHKGRPQLKLEASWQAPKHPEPDFLPAANLTKDLLRLLGAWNVCSKEWVVRQYDHEVQGGSVVKPLVGKNNDGPGDAAVIRPLLDSDRGVIISNGICPQYADIDPYWMAASAIDESLRQIIAVGGSLREVALLDNFCWGKTSRPELMGALVKAAQACYDLAIAYGTPFISGKDSLNNEFEHEGKTIIIPHTLLISAIGVMEDVNRAVTMDFKQPGDFIYLLGDTWEELGGSHYLQVQGFTGNRVPKVRTETAREAMEKLSQATEKGLVRACHDLSEGGLGVALAEMAFAGGLGAAVHLKDVPLGEPVYRDDFVLFSESNSRFLVEVSPAHQREFERVLAGTSLAAIGETNSSDIVEVIGKKGRKVARATLNELKEAWQKPLRW